VSNPDKRWSLGAALGRGTGSGIAGGVCGAYLGFLGGPAGATLGGAIGVAGGFAGGFLGAVIGHWWDAPPERPESFRSAALYTTVVSGALDAVVTTLAASHMIAAPQARLAWFTIAAFVGFVASASRNLLDDLRASMS